MLRKSSSLRQNYECWNCSDIIEGRDPEKLMNDASGHHITCKDPNCIECPFICTECQQDDRIPEGKKGLESISTYPILSQSLSEQEEKYMQSHMCHLSREQQIRSIIKNFYG